MESNHVMEGHRLIADIQMQTLLSFPMWMRFNWLCNTINNQLARGHTEDEINWDKVNEILTTNVSEYDFNFFKRIDTINRLVFVASDCQVASLDSDGIWQEHICKDCGKPFIMEYGEVQFYKNKGLHVPRRCKACRDKRKGGKS